VSASAALAYFSDLFQIDPTSLADEDAPFFDLLWTPESKAIVKKYLFRPHNNLQNMPKWWPVDRLEHTFLPRAVREIGSKRFGNEWLDLNFDCLKALASLHRSLVEGEIVHDYNEDADLPSLYNLCCAYAELNPRFPKPTNPEDYSFEMVRLAIERFFRFLAGPLKLYRIVENEIVEGMCSGFVSSYRRLVAGGGFTLVDSDFWLRDSWDVQLRDGIDGLGVPWETGSDHYFFIKSFEVASISNAPNGSETKKPEVQQFGYATPYMALISALTKELSITKENQPQKQVCVSWIYKNWPRFFGSEPSKRVIGYMATFAREPDAQSGIRKTTSTHPKPMKKQDTKLG
jgi:hypothetical protein